MQTGEVVAHLRAVFCNKVSLFLKEGEIELGTLWRSFIVGFFFFLIPGAALWKQVAQSHTEPMDFDFFPSSLLPFSPRKALFSEQLKLFN